MVHFNKIIKSFTSSLVHHQPEERFKTENQNTKIWVFWFISENSLLNIEEWNNIHFITKYIQTIIWMKEFIEKKENKNYWISFISVRDRKENIKSDEILFGRRYTNLLFWREIKLKGKPNLSCHLKDKLSVGRL